MSNISTLSRKRRGSQVKERRLLRHTWDGRQAFIGAHEVRTYGSASKEQGVIVRVLELEAAQTVISILEW